MGDTKSDVTATESDEQVQEAAPNDDKPGTESEGTEPEGAEDGDESDESDEDGEDEGGDELPKEVKSKIAKLNREAKGLRDRLRDLEEKLTGAKTPEEVAQVTSELTENNARLARELAVEKALRKHGLEEDDAVLLTATTPEEIAAQAERIASRIGGGSGPLRGGLDPTDEDNEPSDPGELAKKYGRRRY